MNGATVNLLLDTRKEKSNKKFPVKLTVYFLESKKRYGTGFDVTREEWNKLNASKLKDVSLKEIKLRLDAQISKATKVIKDLEEFSFEEFEKDFFGANEHLKANSFYKVFDEYIQNLVAEERLGSAATYKNTLNGMKKMKMSLRVNEVTPAFLRLYENYCREKGNSDTTISINLRNIRAIVNKAIKLGFMKREKYPFADYPIPQGRNLKKALSRDHIQALIKYQPTDPYQQKALDFWKFSYLCNGINATDIAHLQITDVNGDFMQFTRSKTKRSRKKQRPIRVALHPMAKEIIQKWYNPENPYIFGILVPGLETVTQRNRIKTKLKEINDALQPIAEKLKIKAGEADRLTTYAARHSFATTLKRKGVPTDEISEYLGHSSLVTTQAYLDSFEDELLLERSKLLVD